MPPPTDVGRELERLRTLLLHLPLKASTATYPFENFVPDQEWIENTGSLQGSVNHSLEVAFGSRAAAANAPIKLTSHGPDLLAVVDVLALAITGHDGENPILIKWIGDLTRAAEAVTVGEADAEAASLGKRVRRPTEKREAMEMEKEIKVSVKKKKIEEAAQVEKAKERTAGNWDWDPEDLEDDVPDPKSIGRPSNPLLDKLAKNCHSRKNPSIMRWRCVALACGFSKACPRSQARVYAHAAKCDYLDHDLVEQAATALSSMSLGAKLEALNLARSSGSGTLLQPSVVGLAQKEGYKKRSMEHNHNVLLLLCAQSLPPTLLDSLHWKKAINHLDPKLDCASGSHMATALIPSEATMVRQKSIEILKARMHLTLSFDGATSRRNQSIYTVHVTTPDTRQSHLLDGHSASGVSHTGQHLEQMLRKVINEIGAERFSAVTSDDAANARLARELLMERYPWLLIFADPCHQMNNTAKDICGLSFFEDANHKLRVIIRFFRKSSYAAHHLVTLRHIHGITSGLLAIGKTRFLTFYYAIEALLPCMKLITDLLLSKVIKTTPAHPLYWLTNGFERREFVDTIKLEMAIIQPFARSVKCLESSASTPADVALFWIASQASLNDLFTDSVHRSNLFPPSCDQNELIADIISIVNGRFEEMIQGPHRRVYITALFLNPVHLGSKIFTRKDVNPLSTKIYLPSHGQNTSASTPIAVPDADLRATLPVYELAGKCLAEILIQEVNSGRAPETFGGYTSADEVVQEFRYQYMNYVRQIPPFNRYLNAPTPRKYWEKTGLHDDANIMGYLGVKLFSVNPNSMAEERTVSNLTKLNSPDRARQKTSTLIAMTQVKQHELRLRSTVEDVPGPAVRFRDLSDLIKSPQQALADSGRDMGSVGTGFTGTSEAPITLGSEGDSGQMMDRFEEPDTWEREIGLDEVIERPELGSRHAFEVTERDGINLGALALLDLLSDEPVDGATEPPTGPMVRGGKTNKNSSDNGKLSVAQFEF